MYQCLRSGIPKKADSTLRCSQAVPHPSTNRALRRLTSEVGRDPVYSTRYGRRRNTISHIPGMMLCRRPRPPINHPPLPMVTTPRIHTGVCVTINPYSYAYNKVYSTRFVLHVRRLHVAVVRIGYIHYRRRIVRPVIHGEEGVSMSQIEDS